MDFRIAVVTPYYKEPLNVLERCHRSVIDQTVGADHFLIADGHARTELNHWAVKHVVLPQAHGDNGNTPRGIGCGLADSEGYDFIAYLDADNWFHPNHLASLLDLWRAQQTPVVASFRSFHDLDGGLLPVSEAQEDSLEHVDTSCMLIHRSAFGLNSLWTRMPKQLSPICDRVYLAALRWNRFAIAHTKKRTSAFRSQYANHYLAVGLEPPAGGKAFPDVKACYEYLISVDGVSECVERLGFYPLPHMATG